MRLAWLGLAIGLVVAGAPRSGEAKPKAPDPTAEAKKHFAKAKGLYKQARYQEAISELEIAYRLKPHGVLFFNIAQAYEKMGEIPPALRNYHEYLRQVPAADDRAVVEVAIKNLEKRLAEKGVQQVLIYSEPKGAAVLIDGNRVGSAPFSAELTLGPHKVGVEIEGYQLKAREVVVSADQSLVLDFTLDKVTEAVPLVAAPDRKPPVTETKPAPKADPGPTTVAALTGPNTPPPAPPAKKGRVWTWVAAGVTGVALAGGVVSGLAASGAENDLLRNGVHDQATADEFKQRATANAGRANGFYLVTGIAGAATVGLFVWEGRF